MTTGEHTQKTSRFALLFGLRLLTAAMLIVDAVVHFQQAANYQLAAPGGIGEGNIFRIEAIVAILVAVWVLLLGSRLSFVAAFLVTGSALVAVVVYRYVDLPGFGPIPAMYEPVWFSSKAYSAIGEGIGTLSAALGVALSGKAGRSRRR